MISARDLSTTASRGGRPPSTHAALEIKCQLTRETTEVGTYVFPPAKPEPLILMDEHPIGSRTASMSEAPHERSSFFRRTRSRQAFNPYA